MLKINFRNAQYLISAPSLAECPPEDGVEVAFAGRSNAGKSSALNSLTGNSKLARTSKTPGRTQLINFFALDQAGQCRLVDLPGYGYAKVPIETKKQWQKHLSEYLYQRQTLRGLVLVMDIRHPLQEFDAMMINWAVDANMPMHLLLTKADKLNFGAAKTALLGVQRHIKEAEVDDLLSAQTFSALKKTGIEELEKVLQTWLQPADLPDQSQQSETSQPSD